MIRKIKKCKVCGTSIKQVKNYIYRCNPCNRIVAREQYYKHRTRALEYQKKIRKEMRKIVFDYYGNKCACCGETNIGFLTLDHINNDGKQARTRLSGTTIDSAGILRKAIKDNFPNDIRLLCYNCNCGRARNGGICPHIELNIL